MKNEILNIGLDLLGQQHFDTLAVGVIDFKNNSFESFEISATNVVSPKPYLYYDLASLTKALTNSAVRLKHPELFDEKNMLLLNHIAGLPSGGLLSKNDWKEFLMNYDVKLSPTLYSDYSSLRCMLEIEKKSESLFETDGATQEINQERNQKAEVTRRADGHSCYRNRISECWKRHLVARTINRRGPGLS